MGKTFLNGRDHSSHFVDHPDVFAGSGFEIEGESLEEVAASEGIGNRGHSGLIRYDLLGTEGECGGVLTGQRPGFIEGVGMEGLGASEDGGEGLEGGANHIIIWLLPGERTAGGLGVEAEFQAAGVFQLHSDPA